MILPQHSYSRPVFASLAVYAGVKKMVAAYPDYDREVVRRKWLGIYYQMRYPPALTCRYISQRIGSGLFTEEFIKADRIIGEYVGLIKKRTFLVSRRKDYVGEYTIPGYPVKYIIDAEEYGSLMRFINHSDEPNCYPITVIHEGILRIYIIAKVDITEGEQLLMDYGPDYWRFRRKHQ